jgi:hypothetical protein
VRRGKANPITCARTSNNGAPNCMLSEHSLNTAAGNRRRNGDGEAQEASHLHGRAVLPVEGLAARILEHQRGPTDVAHELQRPHRPCAVELVPQFVFVGEAIED